MFYIHVYLYFMLRATMQIRSFWDHERV